MSIPTNAFDEVYGIINQAIKKGIERGNRGMTVLDHAPRVEQGECWNCAHLEECGPESDDDTCDSWEGF